jgi:hypothetical protein
LPFHMQLAPLLARIALTPAPRRDPTSAYVCIYIAASAVRLCQ